MTQNFVFSTDILSLSMQVEEYCDHNTTDKCIEVIVPYLKHEHKYVRKGAFAGLMMHLRDPRIHTILTDAYSVETSEELKELMREILE